MQQSRIFYGSQHAAERELSILSGRKSTIKVSTRRISLYDFLQFWQTDYKERCERKGMARSTWKEHEGNVRLYLRPVLEKFGWEKRRLAAFTLDDLLDIINGFALLRGGEPSGSMRASVRKTIVMAFSQAVEDGIISANPISGGADWAIGKPIVFTPDIFQVYKVAKIMGTMPSLTAGPELKLVRKERLKERREGKAYRPPPQVRAGEPRPWLEWMLLTAVWTGLRVGELLALRLEDVDTNNRFIRVRQSASVSGGRFREGDPKTGAGIRIVPILPDAEEPIVQLEDRAVWMNSEPTHLFVGAGKRASRLSENGGRETISHVGAIGYSEISRELREACRIALEDGLIPESFTWHSCRHTFCSTLLSSGVGEELVSKWAGHSSVEVTKNVYSVAMPGNMESTASEVGEMVANYFGGKRSHRSKSDARTKAMVKAELSRQGVSDMGSGPAT